MNRYKICCITSNILEELTKKSISMINDDEIEAFYIRCRHNDLFESVKNANLEGTEVFVAGVSDVEIFRESFDFPIVAVEISYYDYISSIIKASSFSRNIAIVSYMKPVNYDLLFIEEMMNLNIKYIVYEYNEDLTEQLIMSGSDVVIGTSFAAEIANNLGKKSILLYTREETIIKSFLIAKNLAREIRKEREQTEFLSAIIDYSPSGIIGVNSDDIIVNYNISAEKIFGIYAEDARGRISSKLLPELEMNKVLQGEQKDINSVISYKNKKLHVARVCISNNSQPSIGIAIISEISTIKNAEIDYLNKQRKDFASSGFLAKHKFKDILGSSYAIKETVEQAKIYCNSSSNILIYGDTGTGKELFAQSIHNASSRKDQSFVAINCGAIPENLLESELFGYTEGAFTGSRKGGKKGIFELADNGTLFLDEVGEISALLQIKLLRALQEREIMRIGDDRLIPINTRIIAATNKKPKEMIANGFRSDLLYRLNVLELEIPPLIEREDDVVVIFRFFLQKYIDNYKVSTEITDDVLSVLKYYSWPGNIRELENVSQRFALFISNNPKSVSRNSIKRILCKCIGEDNLFEDILKLYSYDVNRNNNDSIPVNMVKTIKSCLGYSNEHLAKKLGTSRTTLWRINKED